MQQSNTFKQSRNMTNTFCGKTHTIQAETDKPNAHLLMMCDFMYNVGVAKE